jgi:hypothetical protein
MRRIGISASDPVVYSEIAGRVSPMRDVHPAFGGDG